MTPEEKRLRRRGAFEEVADLYARVRPGYPDALFDELWALAGLGRSPEVLEIGCGSGQATLSLLRRGARVLAVELGPRLAEHARAATRDHGDRVTIVNADFETWTPPEHAFDLVFAATAFHWLDPSTRWTKIARALTRDGHVAVVANEHVSDERGDEFFRRSRDAYAEAFGTSHTELPRRAALTPVEVDGTLFEPVVHRVHPWVQSFDATAYVDTLATYSENRSLDEPTRNRLFAELTAIIDGLGGRIEKHWGATLSLASRSPAS